MATFGIFDDGDDGHLIKGGFTGYDDAEWYADQLLDEEPDERIRIEPQCPRHPAHPEGDCEDCQEADCANCARPNDRRQAGFDTCARCGSALDASNQRDLAV